MPTRGIKTPTRASAVSAPSHLSLVCSYWLNNFAGEPNWLTPVVPILIGSYETYYNISDLMARAIKPEYLEIARMIYHKAFNWGSVDWSAPMPISHPEHWPKTFLPTKPNQMVNPDFLEEFNRGNGEFYARIKSNTTLQGRYAMPFRFYGGHSDPVVPQWSSILWPTEHQRLQGSLLSTGVAVDPAIPLTADRVGRRGGSHRSTFLASLFDPGLQVRRWFDEALTPEPSA